MTSRRRLVLGALAAVVLLYLFLRGVAWEDLTAALKSARLLDLLGVVVATVVAYLLRAWRWGYLLAPLAKVRLSRLFSVTIVGFTAGLLIPRAGEFLRPYLIARDHSIRTPAAFASIILERLTDLIAMLLLFGLYLYALPMPVSQVRGPLLDLLKGAGAAAGLLALAVLAVLWAFHLQAQRTMALVDRLLHRLPNRLCDALSHGLRSFAEGLAVLQAPASHLLIILAQSFLVWLALGAGFYFNNRAFGLGLPFHTTFLLMAFLTVGVSIPTPGMVGGFHEFYLLALTQSFGVEKGVAAAAGITAHALGNLPVLLLGLFFLGREGLSVQAVAEMSDATSPGESGAIASARLDAAPLSHEGRHP